MVREDGTIELKEFIAFFRPKISRTADSKFNRLIMKSQLGRSKHSSYNLPGKYHTYGAKVPRNEEGAKEVVLTWVPFEKKGGDEKSMNIMKMNKRAIKNKQVKVKEMIEYNRAHPIYERRVVKSKSTTQSTKQKLGQMRSLPGGKAFGRKNEYGEPIYKLVNGEYTKTDDIDKFYPSNNPKSNRVRRKKELETFDSKRPTKASVGHATAARKLKEKPKTPFKMKRFANIEPRVQTTFRKTAEAVVLDSK